MNPKLSLAIGIVCIAFSPIFVRLAGAPPLTSGFYRIFIAWVCLAPYCFYKGNLKIGYPELRVALLGGLVFGADIAAWNTSLMKISPTISTLLANLAPVWVGLMSFLFFKKRSGVWFWVGTCMAVAGMMVLVGYQQVLHLQFNAGILLALLASFFYATYIMITKNILQRIDTLTFMFYNMLAASMFILAINGIQHNNMINYPPAAWFNFLGMSLLCQLLGWLTINYSLNFLESTRVSITLLSQTALAGLLAWIFLREQLQAKEIIGSIIVLSGIAVTFFRRGQLNKS